MKFAFLALLALALSLVEGVAVQINHAASNYIPSSPPATSSVGACSSSSLVLGWEDLDQFHYSASSGSTNCLFLSIEWSSTAVTSTNRETVQLYPGSSIGTSIAFEQTNNRDPSFSTFPSTGAQSSHLFTRDASATYLHIFLVNGGGSISLSSVFLIKVMSQLLSTSALSISIANPDNVNLPLPAVSLYLELATADTATTNPSSKIKLQLPLCVDSTAITYLTGGGQVTALTDLVDDSINLPPLSGLQIALAGDDCSSITNAQLVTFSSLSSTQSQTFSTADRIDLFKIPFGQASLEHRITISDCDALTAVFGQSDATFPLLSSSGPGYTTVTQTGTSITYSDSSELSSSSLIVNTFNSNEDTYGCTGTIDIDAKLDTSALYPLGCEAMPTDVYGDDFTTCTMAMCGMDEACRSDCGSSCAWNAFSVCASSFVPTITSVSVSIDSSNIATLTLTGTQFSCDPVILIDSIPATVISCSATQVVVEDATTVTVAGNRSLSATFALAPCNELTEDVTYEPVVTSITPVNGPTSGSTSVTIAGKYFQSASVTIGGVACTVTDQTSTSITCTTPAGTGADLDVEVTVNQVTGSLTEGFSYDAPSVITNLPTLNTTGGTVTLAGTNFGSDSSKITVSSSNTGLSRVQTSSAFSVVSVTHTSIQITYPAGTGKGWQWTINVDGQPVQTSVTDYAAPTITGNTILDTVGGSVTITGTGFGPATPSITSTARLLRENVALDGVSLDSRVSDTSVIIDYPSGTGSGLTLEITIDGQTVTGNARYQSPLVDDLILPDTAGGFISIVGRYFGTDKDVVAVDLKRDTTPVVVSVSAVTDDSITISYPPGAGTGYTLTITVDGQDSAVADASYAAPTISTVSFANSMLTVTGDNFGSSANDIPLTMELVIDDETITAAQFTVSTHTDTQCVFDITSAGGKDVAVKLTVDDQSVTSAATFDFPAPTIDQVDELATAGGVLTITGTDFTGNEQLVTVALTRGGSALTTTVESMTDSEIVINYPAGVGADVVVSVEVVNQVAESTTRYAPPQITAVTDLVVNFDQDTAQVNITGVNFGTDVDQVACSMVNSGAIGTIVEVSNQLITAEFSVSDLAFSEVSDSIRVVVGGQDVTAEITVQFSSSSLVSIQLSLFVMALFAIVF